MNDTVVLAVLAGVVLIVLARPLWHRRGVAQPPLPARAAVSRDDDEDPVAIALREIELDREMGKLSEADYAALKARYEAAARERAASTGRAVAGSAAEAGASPRSPAVPGATPGDQQAPAADAATLDRRAEELVRRYRREATASCPTCGARPEPDAKFCSSCGRFLEWCPGCGRPVEQPGARFCPACGTSLTC